MVEERALVRAIDSVICIQDSHTYHVVLSGLENLVLAITLPGAIVSRRWQGCEQKGRVAGMRPLALCLQAPGRHSISNR